MSTLKISVTCAPFAPLPARTSSFAPAGMLACPPRSTTLTCRNASPEPSASSTKPKPLSGLYHLTVAPMGGPDGLSNSGPRGGAYPEITGRWLIVVVGEITAASGAKISVSIAHVNSQEKGGFPDAKTLKTSTTTYSPCGLLCRAGRHCLFDLLSERIDACREFFYFFKSARKLGVANLPI
jgi:hypothetical protein